MARYLDLHPANPQQRSLQQIVAVLRDGGLIAYPTEAGYALGSLGGNYHAAQRIREIRGLDERHQLTVVVSDFAQLGRYVAMDNRVFRAVKAATPGPFTFILPATREVPRVMQHPKKRTIGVRVTSYIPAVAILDLLAEPLFSSTLILPAEDDAMTEAWQIDDLLGHQLDAVIDAGEVTRTPTTVIDLAGEEIVVVRRGLGDSELFE